MRKEGKKRKKIKREKKRRNRTKKEEEFSKEGIKREETKETLPSWHLQILQVRVRMCLLIEDLQFPTGSFHIWTH